MKKRRLAHEDRRYKPQGALAPMFDRQADELLKLNDPPDVGAGGEVVKEQTFGLPHKRTVIRDTLREGSTRIAEDASIRRTDLLMQPSFRVLEMGIDAAESAGAQNSLEKMLCHQMALAHESAMRFMDRALAYEARGSGMNAEQSVEACRLANTAARLMGTYQDGLLTLQKLRSGGNQTVTVQHVNVQSGAQAVIGNVRTGGRKRPGVGQKKG
jgi:hypothetical protein